MLPIAAFNSAPLWPLGTPVSMGDDAHARSAMISGWSQSEGLHVWNDGPEAQMRIVVADPQRSLTLTVTGVPLVHPQQPFQEVTLFVNGYRVAFWRLGRADVTTLTATLAPEQMSPLGLRPRAVLEIDWHIPFSVRPKTLGTGSDNRELGFCFHTMCLS